ncbi:MAG TPA: RICIN domain-containing protein [Oligoflexus sp.]|uniref:RICIN domain-containing protein n=1 Tax=Oligoflexus sp. TaxID=1971216 RepID=UPI002D430946|nr:RICIN domain-containing protein [Oligoflexus sp.]HYX34667.1 RICIN domain-containing protein [Oligoflexus sp.]
MVCRWQDVPREPTTANIKCFHTNESGNPIDLGTDVLWVVENPLPEVTVVQKVVGLEFHISISGSTSAIVLDALSIMQVHVKYGPEKSVEKKAPIRDLLETSYPAPNGTVSPSPAAVLRLSHANTLCLQVTLLGSVSLQPCLQTEELQKFKEVVASDRRIQYLNEKTQFCLSSAGGAFADYIISADPCTQDETQYFTKVAADTLFSLRQDSFALCMSAQNAGSLANTKIVLAVCANETSQQFVP